MDGSTPSLVASPCCVSDWGSAVWSPDGSRIAFESEPQGDLPHHYLVVNANGKGRTEGDRRAHVSQLARRLVLLPLLRLRGGLVRRIPLGVAALTVGTRSRAGDTFRPQQTGRTAGVGNEMH